MGKNVAFSTKALAQFVEWWQLDKTTAKRIYKLIDAIQADPYQGIGKPEPLKHNLSGWWSRRITDEHRMVYRVTEDAIEIVQLKTHYGA
jgi:toxin YoeB